MSKETNKFSPEVCDRGVQTATEHQGEHASRWAAIVSIAAKIGCAPHTLNEPRRVSRRLQTLRGWSHGNEEDLSEILT